MVNFNILLIQTRALFWRGFKQAVRPYMALMPEFFMPLFFFIVNTAAFQRAADIPGFGLQSYLQFYAPVALLTAIFISSGGTGIEIVSDISSGFLNRLFLTPVNRWLIVFAKLAAVGVKSAGLVLIMMALLTLFGAPFTGGLFGWLAILLFAFIFAMAWAGIGLTLAFLTKNPRLVQSSFIFFFPFSMITTAQLPLNLLDGWYKVIVQINPVTYILEGMRAVIIAADFSGTFWLGLTVALICAAVTLSIATWAFKKSILKA